MANFHKILIIILAVLASAIGLASPQENPAAKEIVVGNFAHGLDQKWKPESFHGQTQYSATEDEGQSCIKAESNGTASGFYRKIAIDPRQFPYLKWQWKVNNIVANGNAFTKEGDDYAARIYVAFPAFFFWNTKVLVYIWANTLPQNEALPSAYSDNFMMIAVESGPTMTGKWVTEERNIYEDYKKYFGEEPPDVGTIGFMTDTDNTGGQASACYGNIVLLNKPL